MHKITKKLRDHYRATFLKYGATSKGVDWGNKEWAARLRQEKMLNVIEKPNVETVSLLDVGCGYGALADLIKELKIDVDYVGIDVVSEMVSAAEKRHPEFVFYNSEILDGNMSIYDYVVCNGILTQKLDSSVTEMDLFSEELIKKMFSISRCGIAFNLMSSYVNYYSENLYYRNPSELLQWCMSNLTHRVKLDCSYDLKYEYTMYLYKE